MTEHHRPGDSFGAIRDTPTANATATEAAYLLTHGSSYGGVVRSRDSDGTYTLEIDDPNVSLGGVRLALPVLGGLMGFNVRTKLTVGTPVRVVYGRTSFIYAAVLPGNPDARNARNRSKLWGVPIDRDAGISDIFSDHPEDMIEGELEISNLYGVSMDFLTTLLRMSAGDRAAVECHLINDMVRVMSAQFRHISGLGEELIFDHGRPTLERSWSSYRHEVMGVAAGEALLEMDGDEADVTRTMEERVTAVGRHRFVELIGFAGDFIHSFVADPPEQLVKMTKELAKSGAGKSWLHRNSDGSVIIQSVADIRLERVCRIPVPVRCASHEDPTITTARKYDELVDDYLKLPEALSPKDTSDAFLPAYHIRSYSRWLSRYHSFARMLQLGSEYTVPSETDTPTPSWTCAEKDKDDANPKTEYFDAYACITILRDGSVVAQDVSGSAIVMANGSVQISAARHMDLEAAGDIRILSGGSIVMKARRNVDISAVMGGLALHGYAWLKGLCERGSLWLRSNAVTNKALPPEPREEGMPTPEVAGWVEDEEDGAAVLIESSEGRSIYRSDRGIALSVDGAPAHTDDRSRDIVLSTAGSIDIAGDKSTDMRTKGRLGLSSPGYVTIGAPVLIASSSEVYVGQSAERPDIMLKGGVLRCKSLQSNTVAANSIEGPERGPTPMQGDTKQKKLRPPVPPLGVSSVAEDNKSTPAHANHIGVLRQRIDDAENTNEDAILALRATQLLQGLQTNVPWRGSSAGPIWAFPPPAEYAWDNRDAQPGVIPETLTQQYLRLDVSGGADRWGGNGYELWKIADTALQGARTSRLVGFGAQEQHYQASDEGEDLRAPWTRDMNDAGDLERMRDLQMTWTRLAEEVGGNLSIRALKRPDPV